MLGAPAGPALCRRFMSLCECTDHAPAMPFQKHNVPRNGASKPEPDSTSVGLGLLSEKDRPAPTRPRRNSMLQVAPIPSPKERQQRERAHAPKRTDLPFTVRIVRTDEQLERAVRIRAEAYGRHIPTLGEMLESPETVDRDPNAIVFLAEAKNDGAALGTIRIQTNFNSPIPLETSVDLPPHFRGRPLAGVSRLAVKAGSRGRLVKLALFKALHRYCLAKQVEWILIGARPPLDQTYIDLGFIDVFDDDELRPLATAANVPHRILCFEVFTAERRWHELSHPLYLFMGQRFHPDIEIFSSVNNMWARPRERRRTRIEADFRLEIPLV